MINFFLGDSRFFWSENIKFLSHIPYAWDASLNTGIGISQINTLWITSYLNFTSSFSLLGFSWSFINLIFWILPIIILSFISSFFLFKTVINNNNSYAFLAGIIFTTNTYFLSIFLGGQMGVSFAYAFIPLVFLVFIKLFRSPTVYSAIFAGFILSLHVLFDPRLAGLTITSLLFFYVIRFQFVKKDLLYFAVIPFLLVLLLHSFWILPLLFYKSNIIPQGFTSIEGIKFLSFARFENTLSLLHPNWPENIFGKVYFMRPEFLVIPLLAYSSLLFLNSKVQNAERSRQARTIIFFVLLGLISAFMAKGANEPFGQFFLWLVEKVPGFSMFRDSTKFYSLIAVAYSVLIPFSLSQFATELNYKLKIKKYLSYVLIVIFICFWMFSLRLLSVSHVFKTHEVPQNYVQLKDFIVSQHQFFRTLWIPSWQRYGYFSDINPAIGRGELFKEASASGMIKELKKEGMEIKLQNLAVKYVIIPEDSEGELFLDDRKYSEKLYKQAVGDSKKIAWLKKVKSFGDIVLFEVANPRDRFWSPSTMLGVTYTFINPTHYNVSISNAKQGDIVVFSEGFDSNWIVSNSEFRIQSSEFRNKLNSFILPKDGSYSLLVYFQPQKLVNIGLLISGVTFIGIVIILLVKTVRRKS